MPIPNAVAKRALFEQEFRQVIEMSNIFAPVAVRLRSTAKVLNSPYTSVSEGKTYTGQSVTPVGDLTISNNQLTLDQKIGNVITDHEEELSYAKWDVMDDIRSDLYASVMSKYNKDAMVDFLAAATNNATTVALSTRAQVTNFLIGVSAETNRAGVAVKKKVDGATSVRGSHYGLPFVAAGHEAFVNIVANVSTAVEQSSLMTIKMGYYMTPYGVLVINLGNATTNAKQLLYGTGGALTMAHREDMIKVRMGEAVNFITATADDGDISTGDELLEEKWFIKANTKGNNTIFSNVANLVTKRLMT